MNTPHSFENLQVNPSETPSESRADRIARLGIAGGLFVAAVISGALGVEQQSAGEAAGAAVGWISAGMLALAGVAAAKQEALAKFGNDIARD